MSGPQGPALTGSGPQLTHSEIFGDSPPSAVSTGMYVCMCPNTSASFHTLSLFSQGTREAFVTDHPTSQKLRLGDS